MRLIALVLCFFAAVAAQTAKYPAAIASDADMKVAVNGVETVLAYPIASGDTLITVRNATGIVPNLLLTIDREIVSVTSVAGNVLTVVRGFDGTTAAAHATNAVVAARVDAWHHNALKAEIRAIQQTLGPNLSNVSGGGGGSGTISSATYNWSPQSPGGALTAGILNTVTLAPCPAGIAAAYTWSKVYVSGGTGTAEPVGIAGGTCTSGAASGTLIFQPAYSHSGSWTIGPASAGLQEAVNVAGAAGGGAVYVPPGSYTLYGTVTVKQSGVWIQGAGIGSSAGQTATTLSRTGNFGDSIFVEGPVSNVRVSGLAIKQVIDYAAGPPPTVSNKPTSGAGIRFFYCWECRAEENRVEHHVYGIEGDGVGMFYAERNEITGLWDHTTSDAQISIAAIYLHHSASSFGFPTYAYVRDNKLTGQASASRNWTVNGHTYTSVQPVGPKHLVWIASCEVCEVSGNHLEWANESGVYIATLASHAVLDAFLDIRILGNFFDYNRLYGIAFDMSANAGVQSALNTTIQANRIGGSAGTINGIYFAPPATPSTYVRTADVTLINDNQIFWTVGSGILALSGGRTTITGNDINHYNSRNAYPTNGLTCSPDCTGDRMGNSAVFLGGAAASFHVGGNRLGGAWSGGAYDGVAVFTVNGVAYGYDATYGIKPGTVEENADGGVQAVTARSPAVQYDPAFLPMHGQDSLYMFAHGLALSGCGTLGATATAFRGTYTSNATGTCATTLVTDPGRARAGWTCRAQNMTTPAVLLQHVNAYNSFGFTGTTTTGDVISYSCTPY